MINHLALLWLLIAACCGVAPAVADQALPSAGAAGPGQAGEPTPHREPYQPPAPVAPPGPELDGGSSPSSDSEGQDDPAPGAGTAGAPAEAKDQQPVSDSGAEEPLPLRDLRTFAEVFGRIKSDYVEEVDDHELLSSAIRGMLGGLDPHSAYLDPEAYSELKVGTSGEFGGLGIEVGIEDGLVKVISPIDNTPAERAGMQAGDLIVRIDGKPIKGMDLSEAVKLMRGKPGTTIELTVVREGEGSPLTIKIERDIIKVASVKGRTLEPGFGYLRIANFQARTTDDLLKAVATLKEDNEDGLNGVVLDLRNNPGGVLNAAVGVSDAFLERGLIVYTQGRVEDSRLEFRAGPDDVLDGAPIVVLVNGGSASASEIVAGALQDQARAIIMGGKTFGKGSVQTIVPIDDRTALKLTTARYYTPSGRSIQAQGIVPDIELERGRVTLAEESDVGPLKEADLIHRLDGDDAEAPADNENDEDEPLAAKDYQLSEALNVLKGLSLYGRAARVE